MEIKQNSLYTNVKTKSGNGLVSIILNGCREIREVLSFDPVSSTVSFRVISGMPNHTYRDVDGKNPRTRGLIYSVPESAFKAWVVEQLTEKVTLERMALFNARNVTLTDAELEVMLDIEQPVKPGASLKPMHPKTRTKLASKGLIEGPLNANATLTLMGSTWLNNV